MNIYFDHKIFIQQKLGGPSRYIINLAKHLNEEKINAKIFAPLHVSDFLERSSKIIKGFEKKIFFSNQFDKSIKLKRILRSVNNILTPYFVNKFSPDIIHTTYYDDDNYKGKKIVVTVYDCIHEIFYKDYGFEKINYPKKKILQKADHIICISKSTKNDLIDIYNIDENKISVTYLATYTDNHDTSNFLKFPYILYVGSRWKYKNFSSLLKTLSINKKFLKDFKLVIFGGGKLNNSELKLMQELNLNKEDIVHLEGGEKILNACYSNARLLVYPSLYEGFGIPILEAFANNCPVVCSDSSSLPEVAGDAASYFNPNDEQSIYDSISQISYSDQLRNELIIKGKIRLKNFSWQKCAKETLNIYNKL